MALAVAFLSAAFGACSPDRGFPPGPEPPAAEVVSTATVDISTIEPLVFGQPDRHFLALARRSPEFAGAYVKDRNLYVLSTSGRFPEGLTAGTDRPVIVRSADHSFEELARWHRLVYETLGNTAQWIDIDERANRVAVAVPNRQVAREALLTAGVPEGVYVLHDTEPIQLTKTLLDEFRPVPGGVQTFCTVGFNVEHWEWGKTFVIPSHCTDVMLSVDGKPFHQPEGGGLIGTEVFDHPGFTGGECSSGKVCRYSDAVVVDFASGIDYELGKVARTTGIGSITIDDSNPRFGINHEELSIFSGYNALFVGHVSGWQAGEVTTTCASVQDVAHVKFPSNLKLLCQYKMSVAAQEGDSGSPVLTHAEPAFGEYDLAGMIWARSGSSSSWFSPIEGIRKELKPNTSFECDGLVTTASGGCGPGQGGSSSECSDSPTVIEC